jgi:hypothetical protein
LFFAYRPFRWQNNEQKNAAVYCVIVGFSQSKKSKKYIFDSESVTHASNISPYLTNNDNVIVKKTIHPIDNRPELVSGNQAIEGGHLILKKEQVEKLKISCPMALKFLRPLYGAEDFVNGASRYCIWVGSEQLEEANNISEFRTRFELVRRYREGAGEVARSLVETPFRFRYTHEARERMIVVPRTTTERRDYIPIGLISASAIVTDAIQVMYDPELYIFGILSSKLHMAWVQAVAGRLKSDPRYSNTLVYNTFPVPTLTDQNKADLTRCAEDILLAREQYFPATIADMYDPDRMDSEFPLVREAHDRNDETLERIYIGRRFKNDTERLEKLFEMYTKMTSQKAPAKKNSNRKPKGTLL